MEQLLFCSKVMIVIGEPQRTLDSILSFPMALLGRASVLLVKFPSYQKVYRIGLKGAKHHGKIRLNS